VAPVARVELPGGEAIGIGRADPGVEPDLVLDTADLATVYLGAFTFADLARAGRVGECRDGAVADADRPFATTGTPSSTPVRARRNGCGSSRSRKTVGASTDRTVSSTAAA